MKQTQRKVYIISLFIVIFLSACTSSSVVNNDYSLDEKNRLVVYTSHKEEVYGPIIKEFEERTGIWVQVICGGTSEILDRIANNHDGMFGDIVFGGGVESLEAYSEMFLPYQYHQKEKLEQTYKSESNKWTVFSKLPIVFVYNNKLVYETSAPQGWDDLLNERWKGKVAYPDPHKSGTGYTTLMTLMQAMGRDNWDSMERFSYILDGKIIADSGEVINEVAAGTKLIGITLEENALKRIAAGMNITMVYPCEGTSVIPDGSAILLNAPHKENAKLFMDFILDQDVQKYIVDFCYRRSVRVDIPDSEKWDSKEIKLISYDLEWASENRNEIFNKWDVLNP
jgi:iron(III) transport system substrate-binding protein